jgi:Bifunctional nuclease domain
VVVDGPKGPAEVDARPSDALNLALVVGVPVRVDGGVLDRAMAEEPDVPVPPLPAPGGQGAAGARAIVQELLGG